MKFDPADEQSIIDMARALLPIVEGPGIEALDAIVREKRQQLLEDAFNLSAEAAASERGWFRGYHAGLTELPAQMRAIVARAREIIEARERAAEKTP